MVPGKYYIKAPPSSKSEKFHFSFKFRSFSRDNEFAGQDKQEDVQFPQVIDIDECRETFKDSSEPIYICPSLFEMPTDKISWVVRFICKSNFLLSSSHVAFTRTSVKSRKKKRHFKHPWIDYKTTFSLFLVYTFKVIMKGVILNLSPWTRWNWHFDTNNY